MYEGTSVSPLRSVLPVTARPDKARAGVFVTECSIRAIGRDDRQV